MVGQEGMQTHSLVMSPVPGFKVVTGKTSNWQNTSTGSLTCGERIFLLGRARWKPGTYPPFQFCSSNTQHEYSTCYMPDTLPSTLHTLTRYSSKQHYKVGTIFCFVLFFRYYFFYNLFFYWSIVDLQYRVSFKVGTIIVPILQKRKLRHWKLK